ncbi:MAG TPA: hypothetical protein VFA09_21215 [Ktedonobacteraceae bacterium]|nr:hypothetical protein [Ktedonobacteraceae bacterium]
MSIAILLELLYLLFVALSALPPLHLQPTPLLADWQDRDQPLSLLSHLLFPGAWIGTGHPASAAWPYILLLVIVLLALAALHLLALGKINKRDVTAEDVTGSAGGLFLLLIAAAIFGITLLAQPALFSDDVFRYILSGRILSLYHADPMTAAPAQFPHDPYLSWIASPGTPNVYGPLWLAFTSLLARIDSSPLTMLLLFKSSTLIFHLLDCVLIWAILGKIAPARRFLGTLLYAWNPLVLIEIAGNGHNEAALILLLLLAIWLYVQGSGIWYEIGALVLLGLAAAINFIALLVAVLFAWFVVRNYRGIARVSRNAGWRIALVLIPVVLLYIPYWHGSSTYLAITSNTSIEPAGISFVNMLATPLRAFFSFLAVVSNYHSPDVEPIPAANATVLGTCIFLYALIYLYLLGKMRKSEQEENKQERPQGTSLPYTSWSIALVGYIILAVGAFWPSFVLWALWVTALRRFDALNISVLLLSYTALLIYPLLSIGSGPVAVYASVLIFGIPLVYVLPRRMRRSERNKLFYGG